MKVGIFLGTTGGKSKLAYLHAFADGIKKYGDIAILHEGRKYISCDIALIFGFYGKNLGDLHKTRKLIFSKHTNAGKKCIFLDADLLRFAGEIRAERADDPTQHLRVSYGSIYPGEAEYFNKNSDSKRWNLLASRKKINLRPYRKDGGHILICLNSSAKHGRGWSTHGRDIEPWLYKTIEEIRSITNRPIRIRFHPNAKDNVKKNRPWKRLSKYGNITFSGGISAKTREVVPSTTLLQDCEGAWASVVYNTSASVIPVISGIPLFTNRKDCASYNVANHNLQNIESPTFPDRQQWLNNLAYSLWNISEMKSGTVWARFRGNLNAKGDLK